MLVGIGYSRICVSNTVIKKANKMGKTLTNSCNHNYPMRGTITILFVYIMN